MTDKITFAHLVAAFGDPIDTTAVADAITGGKVVRVPEEAQHKARFQWPVALTADVHEQCVEWPDGHQEARRLATLLRAAYLAAARSSNGAPAAFNFTFMPGQLPVFETEEQLTVSFGHDDGSPVVVVAFSHEG
ncbi:hypothetical protein ACGF12_30450 [Kitasatospora sp. NPDC048296]|uniref:hypothetical protein n=1 Tax=Kitasatospora sp. NPDC048296 TaxID=3364048 RepID=UPI003710A0BE